MNKNLCKLLGIATFVLSSSSFADQSGYYVSGNVGIFQADFNNSYLDQVDVIALNIAQTAIQQGYTGGGAIGFRKDYATQYMLGGELSLSVDSQKALFQSGASSTAFSDAVQIQYHADLTFVPGIKLNESILGYLKLGLSWASVYDTLTSPTGFTAVNTVYNSTKNCFGFVAGLGVSKSVTNNVSIFTEANYRDYGSVSFPNFQNFMANYTHKAHVYSYDVVVGASYRFA